MGNTVAILAQAALARRAQTGTAAGRCAGTPALLKRSLLRSVVPERNCAVPAACSPPDSAGHTSVACSRPDSAGCSPSSAELTIRLVEFDLGRGHYCLGGDNYFVDERVHARTLVLPAEAAVYV
eukprot:4569757-Heterocapsa_arctica.AAC.1